MSEGKTKQIIKTKKFDFVILLTLSIIIALGLLMVYSSSWPESLKKFNETDYYFKKQFIAFIFGCFGMFFAYKFDYRLYKKLWFFIFAIAVILNALIFTGMGHEENGARRWLRLGRFMFMPSDILKIASIIALAAIMSINRSTIGTFKTTMKIVAIIGISVGLVLLESDLSTSMVILSTLGVMAFIGGIHLGYIGIGLVLAGLFLYYAIDSEPYRAERFTTFLDPFANRTGTGLQAVQSLYALGSGGLTGLGLGKSIQKFFYLPYCYSDFIFAIIGEELGLIGSLIYIVLLMIFVFRGFSISSNVKDPFGKYLSAGITFMIAVQSMIHILVALSAIPTTGITLPFISYGGTSLLVYMTISGILLNISKHVEIE